MFCACDHLAHSGKAVARWLCCSYNMTVQFIFGAATQVWTGWAGRFQVVSERLVFEHSSREIVAPWLEPGLTEIRTLTTSDIPAFRALRLDALRLHPESFVPTYEEERAVEGPAVAARFRDDWIRDGNFILGAYRDGWLVGAVGVKRWLRAKQRHKATVWLLYTQADARGQGTGRQLLTAAIDRCRLDPEIEMIQLSVGRESHTAHRLYHSLGFRSYGVEPRALRLDGHTYIDVELMALDIAHDDYPLGPGWSSSAID